MKCACTIGIQFLTLVFIALAPFGAAMTSEKQSAKAPPFAPKAAFAAQKVGCEGLAENSLDKMLCEQQESSPLNIVLGNFLQISKIYRKSGSEKGLRDKIIELAKSKGLSYKVDAAGNLMVRVPGTGSGVSKQPLALQSHMDMVHEVDQKLLEKGPIANPDEFMQKVGVQLVVEDGWVHSRNHQSTIGADDGAGVSMAMRYIEDLSIPHPPLELIFTTREELGVGGANDLGKDMLTAKQLVNLDNSDSKEVAIGCLGDSVIHVKYDQLKSVPVPANFKVAVFNVKDLAGGHSGEEIHRHRANAVKLMARLLDGIVKSAPDAVVIEAKAGNYGVQNQIAAHFEATVAIPDGGMNGLKAWAMITGFWPEVQAAFVDPDDHKATFTIGKFENDGKLRGLSAVAVNELASIIGKIGDGVVRNSKPEQALPHDILLSSNLGFLYVQKKGEEFTAEFSIMPRSFIDSQVTEYTKEILAIVSAASFHKTIEKEQSPAWTPNDRSPLLKSWIATAAEKGMKVEAQRAEGGLETAFFVQNFPGLDAIAAGPTIENEHSVNERFNIPAMGQAIGLLDAFLAKTTK